jgi:hypothetical protein
MTQSRIIRPSADLGLLEIGASIATNTSKPNPNKFVIARSLQNTSYLFEALRKADGFIALHEAPQGGIYLPLFQWSPAANGKPRSALETRLAAATKVDPQLAKPQDILDPQIAVSDQRPWTARLLLPSETKARLRDDYDLLYAAGLHIKQIFIRRIVLGTYDTHRHVANVIEALGSVGISDLRFGPAEVISVNNAAHTSTKEAGHAPKKTD